MRKFLERYGWKRIEARKQGCFKMVLWMDKDGKVYPQWQAVFFQRDRNKFARLNQHPACAVDSHDRSDMGDTIAAAVAASN